VERKLVALPKSYSDVQRVLREMLERRLRSLSNMGVIKKNPNFIFRNDLLEAGERLRHQLGSPSGAGRGMIFGAMILQSSALTIYHALSLLESQGPQTLSKFLERVKTSKKRSHRSVALELESAGVFEKLGSGDFEEHPKMAVLEKVVSDQISDNPSSKIMVFTQYRDTATSIVNRLLKLELPVERFVGQASKDDEAGMSQEEQADLLRRFRCGEIRTVVATSIGEEGLDIPNVDLVLFYEPVPSEIRYIQRKGRTGRGSFGKVLILAAENTLDMSYLMSSGKKVERMRKTIKKLNTELTPVIRFGAAPPPKPMSPEEILEAGKFTPPAAEEPANELQDVEKSKLKVFDRDMRQISKKLLDRVLECGSDGLSLEEFNRELEGEEVPQAVVKEAAKKLLLSDHVRQVNGRLVPAGVGLAGRQGLASHSFEVERVLVGRAILLVDEKWRSVLEPESYNGPRHLIKRGVKFKAAADFYDQNGKLHARIHAIESVFS
jgi:Fanconi anemia group M protein